MKPLFIGDEASAAGWRLAGFDVRVALPSAAAAQLAAALRARPPLILVGAGCAAAVPSADLDAALAAFSPPVVVVPDAARPTVLPDLAPRVAATLGIAA